MDIIKRFKRRPDASSIYTTSQIERRNLDIPSTKNISIDFNELVIFNYEKKTKIISASIEYLAIKYLKPKSVKRSKSSIIPASFEEETRPDLNKDSIQHLIKSPDPVENEFIHVPLASEEKIDNLCSLHASLYSILEKIQEVHVSSDFRKAYDIQDKISYLLNNKTLLFDSLADKLIFYLEGVLLKLEKYHLEISKKQSKFIFYNKKISEMKEYKYKTDLSFQMIDQNREIARKESDRNSRVLELSS